MDKQINNKITAVGEDKLAGSLLLKSVVLKHRI
jgi:hypothetical protein